MNVWAVVCGAGSVSYLLRISMVGQLTGSDCRNGWKTHPPSSPRPPSPPSQ